MVPYPRNPFFTGREEVLAAIEQALRTSQAAGITQAAGISGLGGIGKSQTALEYAYRHRAEYPAGVLWVRAESAASLTSSFAEIARLLALPDHDAGEAAVVTAAVTGWLGEADGYLLVLDNVEDPELVHRFLPSQPRGQVLITSRRRDLRPLQRRQPLALGLLPPVDAVRFVLERVERPEPGPEEHHAAEELAKELGYLPLALEQAGAYIAHHQSRFAAYLADHRALQLKLLDEQGPPGEEYPETVRTTWTKSLAAVQERSPAAAALLTACAFLAPEPIPEEMLLKGGKALGAPLASALAAARERQTGMDVLLTPLADYSLIRRDPEARAFEVHRLLQAVVLGALPEAEQRLWGERVVDALAWAYPGDEPADWPACERWLPHAQAGAAWVETHALVSRNAATLLNQAGSYLRARARYPEAEPLLARSLELFEQAAGPGHPDTATSLNNLALLYKVQGKLRAAGPLYQRALAIREQVMGAQHPITAESLNNLAGLYHAQGKLAEAEPLLGRAIAIREAGLGREHPDTAQSINNLASLYQAQGRLAEAEPLYREALTVREQVLGPMHHETAESLNNLAGICYALGKLVEAEPLLQRAVTVYEQALGPMHPHLATSLNNLAMLYQTEGKLAEAEPLHQRALAIREQTLGPMHPDTAGSLNNLALLYRAQGRLAEAEPLLRTALTILEAAAPDHPNTAMCRQILARVRAEMEEPLDGRRDVGGDLPGAQQQAGEEGARRGDERLEGRQQ